MYLKLEVLALLNNYNGVKQYLSKSCFGDVLFSASVNFSVSSPSLQDIIEPADICLSNLQFPCTYLY